jgi:hypothetical protein
MSNDVEFALGITKTRDNENAGQLYPTYFFTADWQHLSEKIDQAQAFEKFQS